MQKRNRNRYTEIEQFASFPVYIFDPIGIGNQPSIASRDRLYLDYDLVVQSNTDNVCITFIPIDNTSHMPRQESKCDCMFVAKGVNKVCFIEFKTGSRSTATITVATRLFEAIQQLENTHNYLVNTYDYDFTRLSVIPIIVFHDSVYLDIQNVASNELIYNNRIDINQRDRILDFLDKYGVDDTITRNLTI